MAKNKNRFTLINGNGDYDFYETEVDVMDELDPDQDYVVANVKNYRANNVREFNNGVNWGAIAMGAAGIVMGITGFVFDSIREKRKAKKGK